MKREIKFRVWDTAKKQPMIYFGSRFSLDDDADTISFTTEKDTFVMGDRDEDGKRFVLMQYTGLKDKNGKEIYEGDILGEDKTPRGIVTFSRGRFIPCYFYNPSSGGWDYSDEWEDELHSVVVEVIGNIYENPELLK